MVVKFLELPFMDEKNLYYCVHSSWIVHRTQEYVMVAFPLQNELSPSLFDMKYRQVRIGIMEYKTGKCPYEKILYPKIILNNITHFILQYNYLYKKSYILK